MAYSAKKPYQTASKDYVQFLKQHVGPESVFEKPYLQKEYGEMNQSPNVPTVPPPIGGTGELVCMYDASSCRITVECYAGPGIRIIGGPEEAAAGYGDPRVIQGAIVRWAVQQDVRAIEIVLDPTVPRNIVEVLFVDGWGRFYTQTVDVSCIGQYEIIGAAARTTGNSPQWNLVSPMPGYLTGGLWGVNQYSGVTDYMHSCMSFPTQVARGASVSAILRIQSNVFSYSTSPELRIYGLDEGNGDLPADAAEFDADMAGNLTTAYTDVDFVSDEFDDYEWTDIDVSEVVEEVIDNVGWVTGNNVILYLTNRNTFQDAWRAVLFTGAKLIV